MDRAYQNAVQRKKELLKELRRLDAFLEMYREFAGEEDEDDAGDANDSDQESTDVATDDRRGLRRREFAKVVRSIIDAYGRPMTRGQLVDAFKERGLPVTGADPAKNVGTMMWRLRGLFTNIEGRGYWPKDVPVPPVPDTLFLNE